MKVNDNKINELLDRAKNYRNDLSKSINGFGNREGLDLDQFQEFFQIMFQKSNNELTTEDNRNIFIQCKITKDEVNKGCMKKIKYKRINENGKKETNEISVKIPARIKEGQSIILYGNGNYIKELNRNSNLIVKIKYK